jgi:hypothetical protein
MAAARVQRNDLPLADARNTSPDAVVRIPDEDGVG